MPDRPPRTAVPFDHHSESYARDREAAHRRLRDECPVAWTDAHGGFWILNRQDDVRMVALDDETFSARHDLANDGRSYTGISIPEAAPMLMPPAEVDPPETARYRKLLNPRLSPGAVRDLEPFVRDVTDWCIDQRIASGQMDLILELANPVSAILTMRLVGLPLADWALWAEPLHTSNATPPHSEARASASAAMADLFARLDEEINRQRSGEKRGLIGDLLEARLDGAPLSHEVLLGLCFIVLGGGVDTTTGLIAAALIHLDEHPGDRQRLIDDPSAIPLAGEEFLRLSAPAPNNVRTATRDTSVGGVPIRKGERLLLCWGAANFDPAHVVDPDEIRLDRFPNRHTSFGLGAQRCIGSSLARMTFRVVLEATLRRLGSYTLDRRRCAPYADQGHIAGFVRLPARFPPASPIGAVFRVDTP